MLRWRCSVCGSIAEIESTSVNYREFRACSNCHASTRTADVARVMLKWMCSQHSDLSQARDELKAYSVYLLEASGPLFEVLKHSPGFQCSEYFDNAEPGSFSEGVRVEDVQRLTFPEAMFDFVISQDVLEHVPDYKKGFAEIFRVLRPGGAHIFTVPFRKSMERSAVRAVIKEGRVEHLAEPYYHKDKLRPEGVLVFTDFGRDIIGQMRAMGFRVATIEESFFDFSKGGYNIVFVAQKPVEA
jgi:SAM-dependent methyltransferase